MAVKIPDAPNIIGSEPVLRSPEQVNGATATPYFKVDNTPALEATNAIGTLLANVNQQRVDTYMTQASLWWTEMMNKKMREVQDKYKGASAMDLYVREIKPYAKQLNDQLFGAPKDDGLVRISNPQLQTAFKKWSDNQMRNYNAQIGHYEGQELARYNESTFDAREQQISEGLMYATTPEEIVGYSQSMLDLNRIRYRGYNPDRIAQLAAAKTDAAVTANVKARITNDVETGYSYFMDPQVQAALSNKSKAELRLALREALVKQGEARGGEGLASGDETKVNHYSSDMMIRNIYGIDDPEEIRAVQMEIRGKAQDRADGLLEKAAGTQAQIANGLGVELANAQTEEEFNTVLEKINEFDPTWAEALDAANQRDALDRATVYYMQTFNPDYDTEVNTRRDEIIKELTALSKDVEGKAEIDREEVAAKFGMTGEELHNKLFGDNKAQAMLATVRDMELAGTPRDEAIKIVATDEARARVSVWEDSPENQQMIDRYNEFRDRTARNVNTYTEVMNDIVNGSYSGGSDPRVLELPLNQQRELAAAAGTEAEYRKLVDSHPGINDVFKSVDATYPQLDIGYQERAKRMAMKRISDWEHKNGDTAAGKQLEQLVMMGYADAKDPIYTAMETAIHTPASIDDLSGESSYWAGETRTDYMADKKRSEEISTAAVGAFGASKAMEKTSDRAYDKQVASARKKIRAFRNALPNNLKYVVDANEDMYTRWYTLGNTTAIIQHVKQHYSPRE